MLQPKCFVISKKDSTVFNDCARSLTQHGWSFEQFLAVDGNQVVANDWQQIGVVMSKLGKMTQRPGAQGCWLSHFALWSKCRDNNNPIVIMEHDAVVNGPWPEDLDITSRLIKLYSTAETKFNPAFGNWSKGSHAYTLTPEQADMLITHAQQNSAQSLDKHLGDFVLPWRFLARDLVTLNPARGPSTTSPRRRH